MLGFQASSSQNSWVTDRSNAKGKKGGGVGVWSKDSKETKDQLSVDIIFSSTEIKKSMRIQLEQEVKLTPRLYFDLLLSTLCLDF